MNKIKSFHHYTIDTGHDVLSTRKDIGVGLTRIMMPHVDRMLMMGASVPGMPSLFGSIMRQGNGCAITIFAAETMEAAVECALLPASGPDREILVDQLREDALTDFDDEDIPTGWVLATTMQPGALVVGSDILYVADLTRCISWTWLDHFLRE